MKQLIRFRKRTALRISLTIFAVVAIICGLFFNTELMQVARGIRHLGAPLGKSNEEVLTNIETKGASKMDLNFLEDTEITYGTDSKTQYSYAYTYFNDMYYIILQEGGLNDMTLFELADDQTQRITVGRVSQSTHRTARNMMIESIAEYNDIAESDVEEFFFPEVVRIEGYRSNAQFAVIVAGGGLALTILVYVFLHHKALNDITKQLDEYEMNRIDEESQFPLYKTKTVILTKSYLIRTSGIKLSDQLIAIDNIAWMYRQTTTHRTYGVQTGKSHLLMVYRKDSKKSVSIPITEEGFNNLLTVYEDLNTDAALGYHDFYISLWKSSKNGQEFVDRINELREQQRQEDKASQEPEAVVDVEVTEETVVTEEDSEN